MAQSLFFKLYSSFCWRHFGDWPASHGCERFLGLCSYSFQTDPLLQRLIRCLWWCEDMRSVQCFISLGLLHPCSWPCCPCFHSFWHWALLRLFDCQSIYMKMWNWDFYVFDSRDMLLWGVALKIPSSSTQSLIALLSRYLKLSSWFSCFDPANLQRRTTQLADFWRNHQSQTCTVFGSILISLAWTVHNRSQNCAVLRRLVILDYDLWLHRWPASGWLQIWWSAMSTLGSPALSESKVHMLTSLTPKSLDAFQWMWGWSRMIWLRYPLVNDEPMIWWHYQATAMMGPPLVVAGFVWKLIAWGEGMLESAAGLSRIKPKWHVTWQEIGRLFIWAATMFL